MPERPPPIARVLLARSPIRLLGPPLLGALVLLTGVVIGLVSGGTVGMVLAATAAILLIVALGAMAALISIQLVVEESAIRISWLGGGRTYPLVPGPVTRVRLRGEGSSALRTRFGPLGVGYGSAWLRGDEKIDVVRLAPTATAILVPTARGRLAVCAAWEEELLDALSQAARARQRLEEVAAAPPVAQTEQPDVAEAHDGPRLVPWRSELDDASSLTGIERALLEQRLADERASAAATAAAEAELLAARQAARDEASGAEAIPEDVEAPQAERRGLRRAPWARRATALHVPRPRPAAALVLLPLLGSGMAWGIGLAFDHLPDPTSDIGRLTALALVLAGPATSVGALMARRFWPRLVAVVVAGGLASSVFIGRALFGA